MFKYTCGKITVLEEMGLECVKCGTQYTRHYDLRIHFNKCQRKYFQHYPFQRLGHFHLLSDKVNTNSPYPKFINDVHFPKKKEKYNSDRTQMRKMLKGFFIVCIVEKSRTKMR